MQKIVNKKCPMNLRMKINPRRSRKTATMQAAQCWFPSCPKQSGWFLKSLQQMGTKLWGREKIGNNQTSTSASVLQHTVPLKKLKGTETNVQYYDGKEIDNWNKRVGCTLNT